MHGAPIAAVSINYYSSCTTKVLTHPYSIINCYDVSSRSDHSLPMTVSTVNTTYTIDLNDNN